MYLDKVTPIAPVQTHSEKYSEDVPVAFARTDGGALCLALGSGKIVVYFAKVK